MMRFLRSAIIAAIVGCLSYAALGQGFLFESWMISTSGTCASRGYQGPGDIVAFTFWGGLRAYSAASCGTKAINVCNVSDVACVDMVTDAGTGALVVTLVGGSDCSMVTCTIKTIYDKAGVHDVTDATIAERPTLKTNCIGALACAQCIGSVHSLRSSGTINTPQPLAMTIVANRNADLGTQQTVLDAVNNTENQGLRFGNSPTLWEQVFFGTIIFVNAVDSAWHAAQGTANNTTSALSVDGMGTTGTTGPSSGTGSVMSICDAGAFMGTGLNGFFAEAGLIVSHTFSGGEVSALNTNEHTFWGF